MTESSEQRVEYLTAETEQGRAAIREVMDRSYQADIERIPPGWARVRLVDGVPVSFILIDPDRRIDLMAGEMRYAFIADAATRTDRRGEGHFRATLDEAFARLRDADIPLVITHGRVDLYRRFGFDVFTHHCGIFARASRIEAHLGLKHPPQARERLRTMDAPYVHPNLLVVEEATGIGASSGVESLPAARTVLQAAAAIARERGRERILFEHPAAPSYGSRYPIYSSLETPLTSLARTCGALICVQGAEPEGEPVPDADWVKVLNARLLVEQALRHVTEWYDEIPETAVCFESDAGTVAIVGASSRVEARADMDPEMTCINWPSTALAQLVLGYRSVDTLAAIHNTPLDEDSRVLLRTLFPPCWRLSRNESWTYSH
ncbi:MAG TPA: GNAT family N-acetyltransferase [Chloroflexi bacterium]|jgi:predicted N-acetyltransferase YhbS|nr:GNAT family N-acetyltransferase [Chloroflexota bacterium]